MNLDIWSKQMLWLCSLFMDLFTDAPVPELDIYGLISHLLLYLS